MCCCPNPWLINTTLHNLEESQPSQRQPALLPQLCKSSVFYPRSSPSTPTLLGPQFPTQWSTQSPTQGSFCLKTTAFLPNILILSCCPLPKTLYSFHVLLNTEPDIQVSTLMPLPFPPLAFIIKTVKGTVCILPPLCPPGSLMTS